MEDNLPLKKVIASLSNTFFKLIKDIGSLAFTEAQLAGKNLPKAILLFLGMIIFSFSAWLGICGIIFISLVLAGMNFLVSLVCVTLINLFFMVICTLFIFQLKENFSFKATKRQLSYVNNIGRDFNDERSEIKG